MSSSDNSVDREFRSLTLNTRPVMPTTRSMAAQEGEHEGYESDASSDSPVNRSFIGDRARERLVTPSRQYDSRYLYKEEWDEAVKGINAQYEIKSMVEKVEAPIESTRVFQFELKNKDDEATVRLGSKKSAYGRPQCLTCHNRKRDQAPCKHVFHLMHHVLEYDDDELSGESWPLNLDGSALGEIGETPFHQIRERGLEALAEDTEGLSFQPKDDLESIPAAALHARREELKEIIASFHPTKFIGEFEPSAWNGVTLDVAQGGDGGSPNGWNFSSVIYTLGLTDQHIFEKLRSTITKDLRDRSYFMKISQRFAKTLEQLDSFLENGAGPANRVYDVKWAAEHIRADALLVTKYLKERKPLSQKTSMDVAGILVDLLSALEQRNHDAYEAIKWPRMPPPAEKPGERNLFESCTVQSGRGRQVFLIGDFWTLQGSDAIERQRAAELKGVFERLRRQQPKWEDETTFGKELKRLVESLGQSFPNLVVELSGTKRGHDPAEGSSSSPGSKRGRRTR